MFCGNDDTFHHCSLLTDFADFVKSFILQYSFLFWIIGIAIIEMRIVCIKCVLTVMLILAVVNATHVHKILRCIC